MKAAIAGYTGLVGREVFSKLVSNNEIQGLYPVGRRPPEAQNSKITWIKSTFEDLHIPDSVDLAFCALGTTIKDAGSQEAFRKVDYEFVLNFAKACKVAGAKSFVVVSALGANPQSRIFYNKVKGETEEALKTLNFEKLVILQPSLLLGDRKEKRPGEIFAEKLFHLLRPLIVGPLRKYRPVQAEKVAQAAITCAFRPPIGLHVLESDKIQSLSEA